MQVSHVIGDKPIIECAKEGEMKIPLDWVNKVRATGSMRAKVECGCSRDEGL